METTKYMMRSANGFQSLNIGHIWENMDRVMVLYSLPKGIIRKSTVVYIAAGLVIHSKVLIWNEIVFIRFAAFQQL